MKKIALALGIAMIALLQLSLVSAITAEEAAKIATDHFPRAGDVEEVRKAHVNLRGFDLIPTWRVLMSKGEGFAPKAAFIDLETGEILRYDSLPYN